MAASRRFLSFETISLIVAFAILASAGVVTMRTEQNRRQSGVMLRHTLEVESTLHRLNGEIRRAESNERGYLITRDPSYFDSRDSLSQTLKTHIGALERLVADNPEQTRRLARLRTVLGERIDLLQHKLALMKEGRFDEAADIVREGRGKFLGDKIESLISDMITQEEDLYRMREDKVAQATDALQMAFGVMIVVLGFVATFALLQTHKQMSSLRRSGDSLRRAYDELIEESTRRGALEAQLRQSQKLEALGQLAGGIAHDFNNMLAVIVASLNIMRRKLGSDDKGLEPLINSAMDGAERAAGLVRRLLSFSRIQPLNPSPLDANQLVAGMSSILHRTLGAHIDLSTELAENLWPIKVDANELESALVNLAVNARDAMPDGGKLTIETTNVTLDDEYVRANPETKPGAYVLVAVCDTGEGMPTDVVAKAFDPFFTTKPIGKGTGLGLSQAHGFVRQSGGHIKIYSEVGRGTCVKLYLPRHTGENTEPAAEPVPEPREDDFPHGRPEELILLVDDDEQARRVTAQGVRELGYTVIEASGGKEAIQILRARADISLLITDVIMPGMDGARLAREAVFRRHALHVLFITGYSPHAIVRNGILDPHANLVTKPFTLAQLAKKIRETLDARADLSGGKV